MAVLMGDICPLTSTYYLTLSQTGGVFFMQYELNKQLIAVLVSSVQKVAEVLSRRTFIYNKVLAKAQFELFYLHYMQRKRII